MSATGKDIRYAVRRIFRDPGFSAIVVLTLAIGIGATTAIFSLVNGLLLSPLPYPEPDRLVELNHHYPSLELEASVSAAGYRRYQTELRSFDIVAAQTGWGVNLTGEGEPERLQGAQVSASWLAAFGLVPQLGRGFLAEEDRPGENRVVILSDGLWQRRFGGDPEVVGRTLTLNGEPYEVVGIAPPGFRPFFGREAEILRPIGLTEAQYSAGYTNEFLTVAARLAPGVTLDAAQSELDSFAGRLRDELPLPPRWTILATTLNERARGELRPALLVLMGAVAFVLLIACANVANLLLARAAGRRREIAVRLALGARTRELTRQLLTESLVLALVGGAAGLGLAAWSIAALRTGAARMVPGLEYVALDPIVLLFTFGIAVLTGVLFGLAPALQSVRTEVEPTLREGGRSATGDRSSHLLRRAFVVAEFALALALLAGAGLLVESFVRLSAVNPGFDPRGLLVFNISLPAAAYPSDTLRAQQFGVLTQRLQAIPGVESVAATSTLPFSGDWSTGSFQVEGYQPADGEPNPWGDIRVVNAGFAEGMRIPLRRGRFLEESDAIGTRPVVVVDEETVRRYWSDEDPIGKRITFDGEEFFDVVGVVGHAAHEGLDAEPRVQLYFPQNRFGTSSLWFALRTAGNPYALANPVREAVWSVDPDQPVSRLSTMEELMAETVGPRRLAAWLLGAFAGLALLLASIGVYGVMSHMVANRTAELGVRMAVGAERGHLLGMVMRQGLALAALGAGIGLVAAVVLTRLLESQLYGVSATDLSTLALVIVLLVSVAGAATLVPALRATRVDPVLALRQE